MSLLSIGKTGLLAAQVGLSTTGNNIANAGVPGYSRQTVVQSDAITQFFGYGYLGTGTQVSTIRRSYDSFLANQLRNAQANQSALDMYTSQVSQVDNLLADPTAGLTPAMKDFFGGVQDANSNPASTASRQALLSSANSLVSRFQDMNARLQEIAEGVNGQISSTVNQINLYSRQIADINGQIAAAGTDPEHLPNDLLDHRDQMLTELNQLVKVNVTQGANNSVSVTFGNGQPLVLSSTSYALATSTSPTDVTRVQVGYQSGITFSPLPDRFITGGQLGGLVDVRDGALDKAQNALGQIAAGLAVSFNAQHILGQDLNGNPGTPVFGPINAYVGSNINNSLASTATITAVVSDASALTSSDYSVDYDSAAGAYTVTRLSDGTKTAVTGSPQTIDGVDYTFSGTPAGGDNFLVRPTYNAASSLQVVLTDPSKLALAAPISTSVGAANTGTGKVSPGTVDATYLQAGNPLTAPVTLAYDKASGTLSGFPPAQDVTVTVNGVPTVYPAGTPTIPYTDGAQISFGGITMAISGAPGDKDSYTVGPNVSGVGDSRNGLLLGGLQTKNILNGGNTTYQTAYAQMVNFVGNKAREAQVNGAAADAAVTQATNSQQSVSGVNLDEEAANLLRYQQAYQAAGKVMQIAGQLFDVLTSLGN
jgi:flagellar hook-associated protein 1 FlgK